MSAWHIKRTDTFLKNLKKHKSNHEMIRELSIRFKRLQVDPYSIGGELAGVLHRYRSTRISGKFRLIYCIDKESSTVFLIAIDHRSRVYG